MDGSESIFKYKGMQGILNEIFFFFQNNHRLDRSETHSFDATFIVQSFLVLATNNTENGNNQDLFAKDAASLFAIEKTGKFTAGDISGDWPSTAL